MGCFVQGGRNGMGCFVRGGKSGMGCFVRGDKNSMECFARGGKSSWDVLSGVSKNGMGCFVPGCFVLQSFILGAQLTPGQKLLVCITVVIIGTGLSALGFIPVNSPTAVHIRKHVFPKGSYDRYTVGEFFGTGFYQYYIHGAQVKKTFKTKVANIKCRLFDTIFNASCGTLIV